MSLIVEDGTGLDDAESYVSIAEADAYFAKRLYSDDWDASSTDDKERALVMATRTLDSLFYWHGLPKRIVPMDQALGWPRVPELTESQWGNPVVNYAAFWRNLAWPYEQVPVQLKNATCELAHELLKADRTLEDPTKGIKSLGVGQGAIDITFDSEDRKTVLTDPIVLMLRPYGVPVGKGSSSIAVSR